MAADERQPLIQAPKRRRWLAWVATGAGALCLAAVASRSRSRAPLLAETTSNPVLDFHRYEAHAYYQTLLGDANPPPPEAPKPQYCLVHAAYGDDYTYQLYARAKIFRRDAGGVHDRAAMRRIMRYNDYAHDPYSAGDPEKAIASRADLRERGQPCCADGNIDAKLAGHADVAALRFEGVSGPSHETLPVFEWTAAYASTPHYGQPARFGFNWTMLLG